MRPAIIVDVHQASPEVEGNVDLTMWTALQEWIELGGNHVSIPFGKSLAGLVPPVSVRLRRDMNAVFRLIEAHALLHQATRLRDLSGAIVADVQLDYEPVRELVHDLISAGVEVSVPETVRETVEQVATLLNKAIESVSLTQLSQFLKLDKSATSRRVRDAIDRGYLRNLEDRHGKRAQIVLGDPMPDDIEILPTAEAVLDRCSVAVTPEGGELPPPPGEGLYDEV